MVKNRVSFVFNDIVLSSIRNLIYETFVKTFLLDILYTLRDTRQSVSIPNTRDFATLNLTAFILYETHGSVSLLDILEYFILKTYVPNTNHNQTSL